MMSVMDRSEFLQFKAENARFMERAFYALYPICASVLFAIYELWSLLPAVVIASALWIAGYEVFLPRWSRLRWTKRYPEMADDRFWRKPSPKGVDAP